MRWVWLAAIACASAASVQAVASDVRDVASGFESVVRQLTVRPAGGEVEIRAQVEFARGASNAPALLLVTGNGPHTRQQTTSGTPWFAQWSNYLASRGFVVMTADARGYGLSTGPTWEQYSTGDRFEDVRACVAVLEAQPEVDASRVGVIGNSEGAMLSLMAAATPDLVDFAVLLAAPGRTGAAIWLDQQMLILSRRGASEETVTQVRAAFGAMVAQAAKGFESDEQYYALGRAVLRAHGLSDDRVTDQLVDQIASDLRTPWYRCFFAWDARDYLARPCAPMLVVWGALDDQTPPDAERPAFEAASGAGEINLLQLPNLDHFFLWREEHEPGTNHDYGRMRVAPALVEAVDRWLAERIAPK